MAKKGNKAQRMFENVLLAEWHNGKVFLAWKYS